MKQIILFLLYVTKYTLHILSFHAGSDGCLYKTDIPEIKTAKIDEIKKSVLECELVSSLSEISLLTLEVNYMF